MPLFCNSGGGEGRGGGGSLDCEQHLAESRLIRIQLQEQKSLQNERDLHYGKSGLEVKVLRHLG